ncbi:MAG: VIT1/CCC1 transporter family protein [Deltaproteobacteria bacterium]|nr:VIT1/CCC1 transporter family protein [Deltaproteobacteria bacterium]
MSSNIGPDIRAQLLIFQKNEITEHYIYQKLAQTTSSPENSDILIRISEDEKRHYDDWKKYTQASPAPDRFKIWFYYWVARILGLTFGIKLMERGEEAAQKNYAALFETIPEAEKMAQEENDHENALIDLLDEERLQYTGSIVLGLSDALVELTGALAGLTLALQNTRLIALTGLITGIAASFSMAASEYLSTKSEESDKHPVRASLYTGLAYVITVLILVFPYLCLDNYFICLFFTLMAAFLIIASFNFYISVAKDLPFLPRFLEMAGLSSGVAALSFFIGWLIRAFLGVDV